MIKRSLSFLFYTALFIIAHSQNTACATQATQEMLVSGVVSFTSTPSTISYTQQVTVPVTYGVVTGSQIITSVSNFSTYYFTPSTAFSTSGSVVSSTAISIGLNAGCCFTVIKVNYLITKRSDILLGSFQLPLTGTPTLAGNGLLQLIQTFQVPSWTALTTSFYTTLFAAATSTGPINYLTHTTSLDATKGILTLTLLYNGQASITTLGFVYVITSSTAFTITQVNLDCVSPSAQYSLIGMDSVVDKGRNMKAVEITFDRYGCVGTQCPSGCINGGQCSSLQGTIIGQTCYVCGANEMYNKAACACNAQSYGAVGNCKKCFTNAQPNSANTGCTCEYPGSIYYNDPASPSNCLLGNTCKQGSLLDKTSNLCVCLFSNEIYDASQGCMCGNLEYLNVAHQRCECGSNAYLLNQVCVPCWPNSARIGDGLTCECNQGYRQSIDAVGVISCIPEVNCPPGQIASKNTASGVCKCGIPSQIILNGVCACAANRELSQLNNFCTCRADFYSQDASGQTDCNPCWPNSTPSPNKMTCICRPNFAFVPPNSCVARPSCNNDAVWSDLFFQCVCSNPTTIFNQDRSKCICPPTTYMDPKTSLCMCPARSIKIALQEYPFTICAACEPPLHPDPTGQKCVCDETYFYDQVNNLCLLSNCTYPTLSTYNVNTKTCECNIALQSYANGCKCPPKMVLDGTGTHCTCPLNTYISPGTTECLPCWANSYSTVDRTTCECANGYTLILSQKVCFKSNCPLGSQYSITTNKCVCQSPDQTVVNNICQCPSPSQTLDSNNKCVCTPTTSLSNTVCINCGFNSKFSSAVNRCACLSGYDLQGTTCVLSSCAPGAVFSNGNCNCIISGATYSPTNGCSCPVNMVIDNSGVSCICNSLSVLSGTTCSLCWANSSPVGGNCICNTGFDLGADQRSCVANPNCPSSSNERIASGAVTFNPVIGQTSRKNCQTVVISFATNSALSSIVSFTSFSQLTSSSGLDFKLTSTPLNSTVLLIKLFINPGWLSISVTYLVALSNYLLLGSFNADLSQSYQCSGAPTTLTVTNSYADAVSFKGTVFGAYAYISGAKTSSNSLSLTMSTTVNEVLKVLTVSLSFGQTVTPVQFLTISFVMVVSPLYSFSYTPGTSTTADYTFIGTSAFNSGAVSLYSLGITLNMLTCTGAKCNGKTCVKKADCLALGGTVNALAQSCSG